MSDTPNDPAAIEHELAQTRARLGSHLDELTRRLSPGQLLDEGLSYLRNGQGAVFAQNLGAQVRDNPLPVALTGIGIAWLAAAGSMRGNGAAASSSRALVPYGGAGSVPRTARDDMRDDMAERTHRAGAAVTRAANESEDAFRARVAEAQGKALGVMRQAQETAEAFSERVRQALDQARETAGSWRDSAGEGMRRAGSMAGDLAASGRDMAGSVRDRTSQAGAYAFDAGGRLAQAVTENPLLLSAMAMTAGALFGALLPRTEFEERQFGAAGERMAGAAQGMAQDMLQRGARVVRAATDAGMQAARKEGAEVSRTSASEPPRRGNGANGSDQAHAAP